ncbi:MAG: alpha/beta fold hydrolase [Burkholderiales bacterium]
MLWAAYFARTGHAEWAALGAVLILFAYALFLALEFVLLACVQQSGPVPRATAPQLFRAWCGEVLSAPLVFCWRQPFRSNAEPDHLDLAPGAARGVVLVHGFVCNRGFWNPWMKALRAESVGFVAVNLEPLFGSISAYADTVDEAVRRVEMATGRRPIVVAHSMGGLAVRAWLDKFNADLRVHRVVTIGTPHGGTWLARYGRTVNSREMALNSPWLNQMAKQHKPSRNALFTCFYSNCDNIVFPAVAGMLAGADNRHLAATAHVHMAFQPEVFNEVSRWLRSPDTFAEPDGVSAVRARAAQ